MKKHGVGDGATAHRLPGNGDRRNSGTFTPDLIPVVMARLRSTNRGASEDLIQDAVADAVLAWWVAKGMVGISVTVEWVRRKALWRLRTILHEKGKATPTLPVPDQEGPERTVERVEVLRRVASFTHSRKNEAVLTLWMNDWTSTEIARRLGLSPATVRKRIERIIERICRECAPWIDGCHTSGVDRVNHATLMEVEHDDKEGRKEGRKLLKGSVSG